MAGSGWRCIEVGHHLCVDGEKGRAVTFKCALIYLMSCLSFSQNL